MAISLQKGQKIDLTKGDKPLSNLLIGLGWNESKKKGGLLSALKGKKEIDIDASVLMLNANGKLDKQERLIYFGNKKDASGSVTHCGDNLVGGKMGTLEDSEQVLIDLEKVPAEISKMLFVVNIYDCVPRNQHFGMVESAYIRIVDKNSGEQIASYNLTEDYSGMTSLIVGEIYRHNSGWKFNAVGGAAHDSGLGELITRYR